ncbi:MAG: hypothetical protein K9G67_11805 [Bacteroidales bacterium]|nr:hypothetical protein [Bacteroidales bacterium]MCF8351994.1 hypothetical protein [Bacteroidales bacterium]MCF8377033.1 hypothetical protein [Bacteroidales bacterium]MCF8400888.1 hypothetical protein [Bacteroidales bacterium]
MKLKPALLILYFIVIPGLSLSAQGLFNHKKPLKVKFQADFNAIFQDKTDSAVYHPGSMKIKFPDETYEFSIELKTRGHYRRDHCSFPPLKVNFKKEDIKGTPFEGSDKIKMVTHCNTDDPEADQNVLTEYLIYKIYNILTDTSFRVALMKAVYKPATKNMNRVSQYAFFIEKTNMVEDRHGLKEFEPEHTQAGRYNKDNFCLVSLFMFMIRNTDWNALIPQNIKLLAAMKEDQFVIVPYDFDLSKWVNPHYAPYNKMDHMELTPMIKGYCHDYDDFSRAIQVFNKNRNEIVKLIDGFAYLKNKRKETLLETIDDFYNIINNRVLFEENFNNYCED